MAEAIKTAFDALAEAAQKIGYGEWNIKIVIYDGRVTGFDQMDAPLIKFREKSDNQRNR